jgi:hypothetical protein
VLEQLLAAWVYCHYYERRENFAIRAAAAIGLMILNSALWNHLSMRVPSAAWVISAMGIAKYLLFFLIGYGSIQLCMRCEKSEAMFCMTCALATQHLSYVLYDVVLVMWEIWCFMSWHLMFTISTLALDVRYCSSCICTSWVRKFFSSVSA